MGLLQDLAGMLGETVRISKTAKNEVNMSSEDREKLNKLIEMAEEGNVEVMSGLGNAYWEGRPVRYDPDEAVKWWMKAAECGHVGAMYNLGVVYHGEESYQFYDENLAGYWFYEAARRGDSDAEAALERYSYDERRGKWHRID